MMLIGRLLKLWLAGKAFSSTKPLFIQLLITVAAITLLFSFATIVAAMLVAGVVWVAYIQLLAHGLSQPHAILTIGVALLIVLSATALIIRSYAADAAKLIKRIIEMQSPVSTRIHSLSEAFMSGYKSK